MQHAQIRDDPDEIITVEVDVRNETEKAWLIRRGINRGKHNPPEWVPKSAVEARKVDGGFNYLMTMTRDRARRAGVLGAMVHQ